MDAVVLLQVRKRPGSSAREPATPSPAARELGFEPVHRRQWSDATGTITLTGWHNRPRSEGGAWAERGGDVAIVAGQLRWRARTWDTAERWAGEVLEATDRPVAFLHDELRGAFAVAHLTSTGEGWLITDPIGMRLLYWGEDDEVMVISTRAAVAAAALAAPGTSPPRDMLSASWLAFTGFRVGEATGYERVRVVPPGARLRLRAGSATWEQTHPLRLSPDDELCSSSVHELAELVHDDVADALRASLSHPADRHVIRLTGGKDSRLVLAVAVRAGLEKEFTYETVGPPELLDVQIASELAQHLGLEHDIRFLGLAPSEAFGDRFRSFVASTACMVNGWDLAGPIDPGEVRLTGMFGEFLRWYHQVPEQTAKRPADVLPRSAFGRLDLVRRDVGDQLHLELLARLEHEPSPESSLPDRVHALYASSRMRFTRAGSRLELAGPHDVHPLYSRATMRASLALQAPDRQSELLFAEVMRQASEGLVRHRFTDDGWDDRARAHLERIGVSIERPKVQIGAAAPPTAPSLMAVLNAPAASRRTDLLTETFADSANPVWEVLDQRAALDGLSRYESLTNAERRELFGAASAATWLGDDPGAGGG